MQLDADQMKFLSNSRIPIRLSVILPSQYPLTISLWYLYQDGMIYCASGNDAKIVKYLRQSPRCGFEIAADTPPYCGIRGYGDVTLYPDEDNNTIKNLYNRYMDNTDSKLYRFLTSSDRDEIVIEIEPRQIFSWNFSTRMSDTVSKERTNLCP